MDSLASRIAIAGIVLCVLGVGCHARAEAEELLRRMPKTEPAPPEGQMEQLPSPHGFRSETIIWSEPSSALWCDRPLNCTRSNRYEIWQLYEVGRYGRFRPRVIYAPYGSFYLDDGRPYPWVSNHPLDFMPYAVGPVQ